MHTLSVCYVDLLDIVREIKGVSLFCSFHKTIIAIFFTSMVLATQHYVIVSLAI